MLFHVANEADGAPDVAMVVDRGTQIARVEEHVVGIVRARERRRPVVALEAGFVDR